MFLDHLGLVVDLYVESLLVFLFFLVYSFAIFSITGRIVPPTWINSGATLLELPNAIVVIDIKKAIIIAILIPEVLDSFVFLISRCSALKLYCRADLYLVSLGQSILFKVFKLISPFFEFKNY